MYYSSRTDFRIFFDYILENKLKIIFIGNTDEIKEKKLSNEDEEKNSEEDDNESSKTEFDRIKEKVIGFDFLIETELESALAKFTTELKLTDFKEIINESCLTIVKPLKFSNLRVIRQSIYYLKQILNIFTPEEIKNNKSYFETFIKYFLVIFFQKSTSNLAREEVNKAIHIFRNKNLAYSEWKKMKEHDVFDTMPRSHIPMEYLFEEIIFDGKINESTIREDFTNWTMPPEEKPAYILLQQNLFDISDDNKFKILYKKAQNEFDNKVLKNYSSLLSFFYMELSLKFYDLIDTSIEDIQKKILKYAKVNRKELAPVENLDMFRPLSFDDSTYENAFREVLDQFKKENQTSNLLNLKQDFSKMIKELPASIDLLCSNVRTINTESRKYSYEPILSSISIYNLFLGVKKCSYREQLSLFNCFNERYGKYYSNGSLRKDYYPDVDFVRQIAEKYEKSFKSTLMSPVNVQRKYLAKCYRELYEWMKSQEDETEA